MMLCAVLVTRPDLHCARVQIKDDVDMIERNKEEEAKRFLSHNIHLDFTVLVRIKECMVDLSSNCMEQALKVLLLGCSNASAVCTHTNSYMA